MMLRRHIPLLLLLLLLLLVVGACRPATQVTLEIDTDALCIDVQDTSITVGELDTLEDRPPSTATSRCQGGRVGSIAIVPSGSDSQPFAVRVVAGLRKTADECVASGYLGGCIVARRALSFIPERNLDLPITLEIACVDIPCGATETCRNGSCVPALLDDPVRCTDPAGCEGDGGSAGNDGGPIDGGSGDGSPADAGSGDGGGGSVQPGDGAVDSGADSGVDAGAKDAAADAAADAGTDATTPSPSDCSVGGASHLTVQSALDDSSCARVLIPAGTFLETLVIARDVEVVGDGTATTVIDAAQAASALQVADAVTATVRNLTLTGGLASQGGGVHNSGTLTLLAVDVTGNTARDQLGRGGGIYSSGGDLTLGEGTRVLNNLLEDDSLIPVPTLEGGGIYAAGGIRVELGEGVQVESNRIEAVGNYTSAFGHGGGIALRGGATLEVTGVGARIRDNEVFVSTMGAAGDGDGAEALGGGVYCENAAVRLGSVDLSENRATSRTTNSDRCTSQGGGAHVSNGCGLRLSGGTASLNVADAQCVGVGAAYGGAFFAGFGGVDLLEATIEQNSARATNPSPSEDSVRTAKGGALYLTSAASLVRSSSLSGNLVTCVNEGFPTDCAGGGIAVEVRSAGDADTTLAIVGSTLDTNQVIAVSGSGFAASNYAAGGGLYAVINQTDVSLDVDVENSTLSGNSVSASGTPTEVEHGGGMALWAIEAGPGQLSFDVLNSTVVANDAGSVANLGGGLMIEAGAGVQSGVRIGHSVFAANVGAGAHADVACDPGENLHLSHANVFSSDVMANDCTRTVDVAPTVNGAFAPQALADNGGPTRTHALTLADTDAVNAGDPGGCTTAASEALVFDQRGQARAGACTLGAFEPTP